MHEMTRRSDVEPKENRNSMDVKELADFIGCDPRTIWRHEAKGLIPEARRVGTRIVRWDRQEIEDWWLRRN